MTELKLNPSQEIFDKIADHLLRQGKKSEGPSVMTPGLTVKMYRDSNGMKCAIGCLIPEERYHPVLELRNIFRLMIDGLLPGVTIDSYPMLLDLRNVHDLKGPETWSSELDRVARSNGLLPFPRHQEKGDAS